MSINTSNSFESYLDGFSESDWLAAVESIAADIHEVDRNATRIWFRFFPLELFRHLHSVEDLQAELKRLAIQGRYELKDQVDSSHHFLYGHRYWPQVKLAIEAEAEHFAAGDEGLAAVIRRIAGSAASAAKTKPALTLGITAVGLMTLVQAGLGIFKAADGKIGKPQGLMNNSPDKIVSERSKDDSQGLLGFLKTIDKQFTVSYQTPTYEGKFRIINDEEIASASAKDQSRDWKAQDERCWEGVVPVECRSAACGTCWVGVLGGEEKLSEVARLERKQTQLFGYHQPEEAKPYLRLACQAKAYGNVTIVIPPWNGVFGREIYGVEEKELEPATTSAKKNRTIVKDAVKNQLM